MTQEEATKNHDETPMSRPKRQSTKPKYFDDYDCTVKGKGK